VADFVDEVMREDFICEIEQVMKHIGKTVSISNVSLKSIYKEAVTQKSRQIILEKFFRRVFSENTAIGDEQDKLADEVDCELNRVEFAEALALTPGSLFVEQLFSIVDNDDSGYVSFRELSYALVLFSEGKDTCTSM
ncbi:unnamed protein product, partial [Owenia fusiformis]